MNSIRNPGRTVNKKASKAEGTSTQRTLHAAVNSSETTANGSSSKASIRNPGKTVNKKVSGKERSVYYTTKDGKAIPIDQAEKNGKLALKDKQSVAVKTARFLQKLGLGGNYYFFESYVDQNGHRVFKDRFGNIQSAPNGLYYSDGDIYIDINAGTDSHSITLRTLSHELSHMIQQWSAAKYKGIADFLAEQYDKEGRSAYEAAKAKQAELSEFRGKTVSFQEAYHEFVADSMSTLFDDGNMYEILTDLKKKDKTIFDYIKKFFDGLAAKVRRLYGNTQAETDEGQFVQGLSKDTIYRLQQMFADALVDASENYAASKQKNTDTQIGVQYSLGYVDRSSAGGYDFTKSFKEQLDDYQRGTFPPKDTFLLGKTPEVLRKIGLADIPLTMDQTHVSYALDGSYSGDIDRVNDHILSKEDLAKIPALISDPVAIIQDKQLWQKKAAAYSVDVLIEMEINGKKTLVAVNVNSRGHINGMEIDSNRIQTIHGNADTIQRLINALNEDSDKNAAVFYINKEKATKFLRPAGNPISRAAKELNGFIHSVTDPGSNVKLRISSVTESQQFKRWFGDWQNHPENASKVVNADGTPMVVYHGSAEQFTAFSYGAIGNSTGVGILGDGFYFTDKRRLAKNYGDNVYPVYLQMKKPYMATESDAYKLKVADLQAKGYDGVILRAPQGDVYMVFENTQIKSATDNIGTFDGSNPDIRYQDRTTPLSNRGLLAQALEGAATEVEDYHTVKEYQRIVPLLDAEEAKLSETGERGFELFISAAIPVGFRR